MDIVSKLFEVNFEFWVNSAVLDLNQTAVFGSTLNLYTCSVLNNLFFVKFWFLPSVRRRCAFEEYC